MSFSIRDFKFRPLMCAAILAGFGFTNSAVAVTVTNDIFIRSGCGDGGVSDQTSSTAASAFLETGGVNCAASAQAYANGGVVGISGSLSQSPFFGQQIIDLDFSADSVMRGIVIKAADGYTHDDLVALHGTSINVGVNAHIDGVLFSDLATSTANQRNAESGLRAFVEISGFDNRVPQRDNREVRASSVATNDPGTGGIVVVNRALTPTVSLSWANPFDVIFRLQGNADTRGYGDSQALGSVDAFNSLSFSSTGPAFFLPTGFTVDAPELGIFDNRWIDPRSTPSAVPLPAGLPLLLGALAILGVVRRRV